MYTHHNFYIHMSVNYDSCTFVEKFYYGPLGPSYATSPLLLIISVIIEIRTARRVTWLNISQDIYEWGNRPNPNRIFPIIVSSINILFRVHKKILLKPQKLKNMHFTSQDHLSMRTFHLFYFRIHTFS